MLKEKVSKNISKPNKMEKQIKLLTVQPNDQLMLEQKQTASWDIWERTLQLLRFSRSEVNSLTLKTWSAWLVTA